MYQKALLYWVLGFNSETQVSDLGPSWPSCFKITNQNKAGSVMGSCYPGYHIAEDHILREITICNIEVPGLGGTL